MTGLRGVVVRAEIANSMTFVGNIRAKIRFHGMFAGLCLFLASAATLALRSTRCT